MENKKTVVEEVVEFFRNSETKYLYASVVDEWIKTFIEKEKQQIKDAFNAGEHMAIIKERLDYDEEDYKYKNSESYYEYLRNK